MTDATSAVAYEYSGPCCPSSSLRCDWSTLYCDDLVEGLSANSELTWSSDELVSASGWMICMSEDPDGNYPQVNEDEDDSASAVAAVVVLLLLLGLCCACCCLVALVIAVFCVCTNSKSKRKFPAPATTATPTMVTPVVADATAVTAVEVTNVQLEDNPDAELPPTDDNRPAVGEEDNPDAGLH
eukprot:CAMPEP_0194551430 /NCGR_PEP_ID=MMETSP0253-20130528/96218_1 /TAXON_ID=2966 /ORGANISM="Noctiluca scintillans" /LENGTH=183 /DNA_ID=CAMNT_0039398889 /DNA_START=1524 /DNA_END=2075 /DNA_ORIENTATION=+